MLWNVEGLKGTLKNIHLDYVEFFKNFDLLCFTETFCIEKTVNIPGFYSVNLMGSKGEWGRPKRGISIFFSNRLGNVKNKIFIKDCTVICTFQNFVVILCYFNPAMTSLDITEEILEAMNSVRDFKNQNVILLGDFNCRVDIDCDKGKAILEITEKLGLVLANSRNIKTYGNDAHGSTIDLVFYSKNFYFSKTLVNQKTLIKTHHPVECTAFLACPPMKIPKNSNSNKKRLKIDLDRLMFLVENDYVNLNTLLDSNNIEDFYIHMVKIINGSKIAPRKRDRRSKIWFDEECYSCRQEVLKRYHRLIMCEFKIDALLSEFKEARKLYKNLISQKKLSHQQKLEERISRAAEEYSYMFLRQPQDILNKVQLSIPLEECVEHMTKLLNIQNLPSTSDKRLQLKSLLVNYDENIECTPISQAEVEYAIKKLKNNKAPGPDMITNENIKTLFSLVPEIFVKLFNKCLDLGTIPQQWKQSTMKMVPKSKGDHDDINSYRGISLCNTLCKLLDKIMSTRLLAKFENYIPKEQFGFMPGKSTIDAINQFQINISENRGEKNYKKYALFIDLKSAFDLTNRKIFIQKLMDKQKLAKKELLLLSEFLEVDYICLDDGVSTSEPFAQSNGFKQGMSSSPICFNIYIYDMIKVLDGIEGVDFLLFADDIVFISDCCSKLEIVLEKFAAYCADNKLKLNIAKTKVLKFTNSGKGRKGKLDKIIFGGKEIEFVPSFPYLGVTFQKCSTSFSKHVTDRCKKSLTAMHFSGDLRSLSLNCAKSLFSLKFAPMATYGIEAIWSHLKLCDLITYENLMTRYFKKVLGVSKFSRSSYLYVLIGDEELFVTKIKQTFKLADTPVYVNFLDHIKQRREREFNDEIFQTPAMLSDNWKRPLYKKRHVQTRFAMHGFHHLICTDKSFHIAKESCKCKLCDEAHISQYHLIMCPNRVRSLSDYANMEKDKT
jgi:hypothetical protein